MPISKYYGGHGSKVMKSMKNQYGEKKGESVFYATANKQGATPGADAFSRPPSKGAYIEFDRIPGKLIRLSSTSDASIDAAVKAAGLWKPGKSYPEFRLWEDGGELFGHKEIMEDVRDSVTPIARGATPGEDVQPILDMAVRKMKQKCPQSGVKIETSDVWSTTKTCAGCGREFKIPLHRGLRKNYGFMPYHNVPDTKLGKDSLYHGTTSAVAEAIKKNGLSVKKNLPTVTSDRDYAERAAQLKAEERGGQPVVVVLKPEAAKHFDKEGIGKLHVSNYAGRIHPRYIDSVDPIGRARDVDPIGPEDYQRVVNKKPWKVGGGREFWKVGSEVYANLVGSRGPIEPLPGGSYKPSNARWECSVTHFERYSDMLLGKDSVRPIRARDAKGGMFDSVRPIRASRARDNVGYAANLAAAQARLDAAIRARQEIEGVNGERGFSIKVFREWVQARKDVERLKEGLATDAVPSWATDEKDTCSSCGGGIFKSKIGGKWFHENGAIACSKKGVRGKATPSHATDERKDGRPGEGYYQWSARKKQERNKQEEKEQGGKCAQCGAKLDPKSWNKTLCAKCDKGMSGSLGDVRPIRARDGASPSGFGPSQNKEKETGQGTCDNMMHEGYHAKTSSCKNWVPDLARDGEPLEHSDEEYLTNMPVEPISVHDANIEFSDRMKFNTSGSYRVERRSDGYYVVGQGMLVPVDSYQEGKEFIASLSSNK